MADTSNVCVKCIAANKKIDGRAISNVNVFGTYQYLERDTIVKSIPTGDVNNRFVGRFDNPTYYTA